MTIFLYFLDDFCFSARLLRFRAARSHVNRDTTGKPPRASPPSPDDIFRDIEEFPLSRHHETSSRCILERFDQILIAGHFKCRASSASITRRGPPPQGFPRPKRLAGNIIISAHFSASAVSTFCRILRAAALSCADIFIFARAPARHARAAPSAKTHSRRRR